MKRKCSYLLVASVLAVAGIGCGDDDSVSTRDSGTTTTPDSGTTVMRDSGTVVRDGGASDSSTGDSSTGDAAADGGPMETFIAMRFAHFIEGAGDVGVCANTGTEITLLNTLLGDGAPPALSEELVTDFVWAPASALPAGTTLEVYEFGDISGTTCPDGSGSESPIFSVALADLGIDPTKAYTIAAIGEIGTDIMDEEPTLLAVEEVFEPADPANSILNLVLARPREPAFLFCILTSGGTNLRPGDTEGLAFGEFGTAEFPVETLTSLVYFNEVSPGGCPDESVSYIPVDEDEDLNAFPDNGDAATLFVTGFNDRVVVVPNVAPTAP